MNYQLYVKPALREATVKVSTLATKVKKLAMSVSQQFGGLCSAVMQQFETF